MKQLRAHNTHVKSWIQVTCTFSQSNWVQLHCSSSAIIKQSHTHHKHSSYTKPLWICLLHQPNTNCTKIEIDRKIDLTICSRECAESLAHEKLEIHTVIFIVIAKRVTMSYCRSNIHVFICTLHFFYIISSSFGIFPTFHQGDQMLTSVNCSCSQIPTHLNLGLFFISERLKYCTLANVQWVNISEPFLH